MIKWPEKYGNGYHGPIASRTWDEAIDAYRAALEKACSQDVLVKVIVSASAKNAVTFDEESMKTIVLVADSIRKHLEGVNDAVLNFSTTIVAKFRPANADALAEENKRMREALEDIARGQLQSPNFADYCIATAKQALGGKTKEKL